MLPNVDITTNVAASGGQGVASRRQENEKALEAYRAAQDNDKALARRQERAAENEAVVSVKEKKPTERVEKKEESSRKDRVEINLQVTREERDALVLALGTEAEKSKMTPEERESAQKASERIVKYVDEAIAKNKENRERVEKAVGEWYSRLSKGESWSGTDLIQLFRQAASGQLDELYGS